MLNVQVRIDKQRSAVLITHTFLISLKGLSVFCQDADGELETFECYRLKNFLGRGNLDVLAFGAIKTSKSF